MFSLTCALAVGNVYSAQPLLESISATLQVSPGTIGLVITAATQAGYAMGLFLLVPLGDRFDRKKLVVTHLLFSVLALIAAALAESFLALLVAMLLVGVIAVVTQTVVAWAAILSAPAQRGKVVGSVTSGIVMGILLARLVSGIIADIAGWRAVYITSATLMLLITVLLVKVIPAAGLQNTATSVAGLQWSVPRLFVTEPLLRQRGALALLIFAAFSMLWSSMVLPLTAMSLSHTQTGLFSLAGIAGALAASRSGAWADRGTGQRASGCALVLLTLSWLPHRLHAGLFIVAGYWRAHAGFRRADGACHQPEHADCRQTRYHQPAYRCLYVFLCGRQRAGRYYCHPTLCALGWYSVCGGGALVSACALILWYGTRQP
ncbi:hypothetical protein E05_27920 [Plautia stali symbiont]|nr:hypothetical protein E05_27920 [Plautia stali symbiont]